MKHTTSVPVPFEQSAQELVRHVHSFRQAEYRAMEYADRQDWIKSPCALLNTLRVFSCGIFVEGKNHSWTRKNLPEGVLIYCVNGRGIYRRSGREWEVQRGDLLYCPPLSEHSYRADSKRPWTICWMHISGEALPEYESILGLREEPPVRSIGVHEPLIQAFQTLIRQFKPDYDDARRLVIQTNAQHILGTVAALPKNIGALPAQGREIQTALDWMDESLHRPFDLMECAKRTGYSPDYFTRLFKLATGTSPVRYFIEHKMHRARTLLGLSGQSIKSIAAQLGYDDALYFSRVFKKHQGVSPQAYRDRLFPVRRRAGLPSEEISALSYPL